MNAITGSRLGRTVIGMWVMLAACVVLNVPATVYGLDDAHWRKGRQALDKGIAYLRSTQNDDGSWSPEVGPAVTALVVGVMLDHPGISQTDPAVERAIKFILSHAREDGGIHSGILANYNTSISVSALSRISNRPDVAEVIAKAQIFLRGLQWNGQKDPEGNVVDEDHPWYGGAGYGGSGRPDMSNTHFLVQALYDSGVDCEDPAFKRALVFLQRCQGIESNDLFADKIDQDGGFIYATSINKDRIGVPESKASPEMIDEGKAGRPVSGLRTYGSITYAGFKSYLYADLDRDDPRVTQAIDWIRHNFTLDQNPGMPEQIKHHGYYYYFMTFGRAMGAWGVSTITDAQGQTRVWGNELVTKLVELQREDGSWVNSAQRWMEGNPDLVTAYVCIALTEATK